MHNIYGLTSQDRIKVIYIAGWGHSGSTLLDILINASPSAISVGEFIYFNTYWDESSSIDAPLGFICTCNVRFKNCCFWKKAISGSGLKHPVVIRDNDSLDRIKWIIRYINYKLTSRKPQLAFGDDSHIFRSIRRNNDGIQFICDSSKDFSRLIRLLMMDDIDVYTIHLIRDAGGVATSYSSHKRKDFGLPGQGYYMALIKWTIVNLITIVIIKISKRPNIKINYSNLCRNPRDELIRINEFFNLDIPINDILREANKSSKHNIGGNRIRFDELTEIRSDERWKSTMPLVRKVLTSILVGPFNHMWRK